MEILRVKLEDSDDIGALLVEAWRHAYKGIMPTSVLDGLCVQSRSAGWKNHIENGAEAYVLRKGSELLGVVQISEFRDEINRYSLFSEIPVLYLKPAVIGMGYGSKLLAFAHERISAKNTQGTVLWVLEQNSLAISFYIKHGYSYTGESKIHETGLVEHLYIKPYNID